MAFQVSLSVSLGDNVDTHLFYDPFTDVLLNEFGAAVLGA